MRCISPQDHTMQVLMPGYCSLAPQMAASWLLVFSAAVRCLWRFALPLLPSSCAATWATSTTSPATATSRCSPQQLAAA
jgi:hypothetical protein